MNYTAVVTGLLLTLPAALAAQAVTSEAPWVYEDYMMVDGVYGCPGCRRPGFDAVFWSSRKLMGYVYYQRHFDSLALMLDWCQKNNVEWGWKEGNHGYGQLFYRQNDTQENPSFGNVKAKPAGYGDASSSNPVGGERLCFVRKDILETHPSWSQTPARATLFGAPTTTTAANMTEQMATTTTTIAQAPTATTAANMTEVPATAAPTTAAPTTAAPATAAPTTTTAANMTEQMATTTTTIAQAPTGTAAPTTVTSTTTTTVTTTVVYTRVSGVVTIFALGVNAPVIAEASTNALAAHFGVPAELITATAVSQTRRLDAASRRLSPTWDIVYQILAPLPLAAFVAKVAAEVTSDIGAFIAAFTELVKSNLIDAGVELSVVNSISVTRASAEVTGPDGEKIDPPVYTAATSNIGAAWLTSLLLLFSMLL